jgi:hypothetical protein
MKLLRSIGTGKLLRVLARVVRGHVANAAENWECYGKLEKFVLGFIAQRPCALRRGVGAATHETTPIPIRGNATDVGSTISANIE